MNSISGVVNRPAVIQFGKSRPPVPKSAEELQAEELQTEDEALVNVEQNVLPALLPVLNRDGWLPLFQMRLVETPPQSPSNLEPPAIPRRLLVDFNLSENEGVNPDTLLIPLFQPNIQYESPFGEIPDSRIRDIQATRRFRLMPSRQALDALRNLADSAQIFRPGTTDSFTDQDQPI
jgi:hypothetical protein